MLTKADRNTRVMVNTPTRVLFILDRTIFLESLCSGAGKSCHGAEGGQTRNRIQWTPHTTTEELGGRPPHLCLSPTEPQGLS